MSPTLPDAHGRCHLVGSVPLESPDAVFRTVSTALGSRLRRLPDGELGRRSSWITWQAAVLAAHPDLEPDASYPPYVIADENVNRSDAVNLYMKRIRSGDFAGMSDTRDALYRRFFLKPRAGIDASAIDVDPLYAAEALASYQRFRALRRTGAIAPHLRFQVCLPTAAAICASFISPTHARAFHRSYERALVREIERLAAAIPADELAIQLDLCIEFMQLEGVYPEYFSDTHAGNCASIARLAAAVPEGVELGFHLCYGDAGGKHIVEPRDGTNLTRVANALASAVPRRIDWLHLPVPFERCDDAYFAPFHALRLDPGTEVYVGLLHDRDGGRSNATRLAAAERVFERFGVATECGFGRRGPGTIAALLTMHADVASSLAAARQDPA